MVNALDYLARNVHKFEEGAEYVALSRDVYFYKYRPAGQVSYSRQEWLDRRAELQNKPSWNEVPSNANYMEQGFDGVWGCWNDKPTLVKEKNDSGYTVEYWGGNNPLSSFNIANKRIGEVLGDWRDTLERRPADLSERAVTARLQEATDNVLAAVPELKSDKYKFEPFTSLEDAQPELVEMTPEMVESLKAGRCLVRPFKPVLHTIHHAAFLHQGCQLLLSEPELVVFRTAEGELIHCKPKECLIDPDQYGMAARLLSDMSGHQVAPEHMRELVEQMNWRVE